MFLGSQHDIFFINIYIINEQTDGKNHVQMCKLILKSCRWDESDFFTSLTNPCIIFIVLEMLASFFFFENENACLFLLFVEVNHNFFYLKLIPCLSQLKKIRC